MDYRPVILLAVVASALGGPARLRTEGVPATCSSTCTGNSKFSYAVGKTHQYKYEAETKTSMLGASLDHSTIGITAKVDIDVISKCELVLRVYDASIVAFDSRQVKDQDPDKTFAKTLEQFPLRFSFQDGVVESVCPHDNEKTWAVNIKKGILSAIQNSMDSLKVDHKTVESDVTGKCETEYKVSQIGWRSLTIKKTKDISSCSHRQGFHTAIQTAPFRVSSGVKSLPILRSSQECEQEVRTNGPIQSVLCHETHLFRPFSKDDSGAQTEVIQKLDFLQEININAQASRAEGGSPQELFFTHLPETEVAEFSAREGLDLLRDLCDTMTTEVTVETNRQFASLVSTMKKTDYSGLRRIYNQVNSGRICQEKAERIKQIMLDAIPMVGTDASIELMKTLITDKTVTGSLAEAWMASLAFVHHPTKEMIKYVQELTGYPSLETKVLLPLSVMVQSYCRVNPSCGDVQEVKDFIDILQKNLESGCKVDQQNFKKTMMTLRALGNTGHAEAIVPSLYQCIEPADNPMDIRVAAIQAFRRLDCATDRNNLMAVYRDDSQDSELRIAAYLAVMRCPNDYFISQITETLATEQVSQVGSFVWSHLSNLMESSDPENRRVRDLLNDVTLDTQFDLEKMKFSRNYEGSFYMDSYNAGMKADSNVIWSSKSFIPRTASLNLTFNLFGESMNLFEMGGRVEGLETLLESYFGPQGYYGNKDRASNNIPDADPTTARLSAKKFDDIRKQAKSTRDELRGAMYMRMFGNELSYTMFGANNGVSDGMPGSEMFNFLQKLRNNEKQDLSITKNMMFIDSTYTVPTVVGLPLKLVVNGTASMALNIGGNIDMKNPKSSIIIEGNFEPSGSVEVDSSMGVDAVVTRGGLKMVSTLYTSTGARAKMQIDGGNVFDLSFDLTKEKSEILDVKSSFYITYNEEEREQAMISSNRQEKTMCSGDQMVLIAGIEVCASVWAPDATGKPDAPYFPFTGPASVSVVLTKKDLPNGFTLGARSIQTPDMSLLRFKFDTPGSKTDRAIGLDVQVIHKDKTLDVSLLSPWKKAVLKGQMFDTSNVKGISGTINVDDDARVYQLSAKILIDKNRDRTTYTPQISLVVPEWKTLQLSGAVHVTVKKEFEVFDSDLILSGAADKPIHWEATIRKGRIATLKISQDDPKGYLLEASTALKYDEKKGYFYYNPKMLVQTPTEKLLQLTSEYTYKTGKTMKMSCKLEHVTKIPLFFSVDLVKNDMPKKNRIKYTLRARMDGPRVANKLMVNVDNRDMKNILTTVRLDYNMMRQWRDTLKSRTRVKTTLYKNKQIIKLTSDFNSAKYKHIDHSLTMNMLKTRFQTNLVGAVKYGTSLKSKTSKERLDFTMTATHRQRGQEMTVNYTLNVKLPPKKLDLTITGGNIHDDKSAANDISIQYHPERTVAFSVRYHNRSAEFPNYAGSLSIYLPEGREMSFSGAFGKENENKYVSNLEFEIIKGRRSRFDTLLKIVTDRLYEFEVGIRLPELEPLRVLGAYGKTDTTHTIEAACERGDKMYKVISEVMYEPEKKVKAIVDVTVPARRVKLIVGLARIETENHMLLDIQWDADKNLDDRFLTNLTYDIKSKDDFEVSTTLHYPSRTIEFNIKHNSAARYITNVDLSWSPKEKIEFNIIFRDDIYNGADRTELSVDFTSPFDGYEELGLAVSLVPSSEQFQTKISVTWAKKKKILISTTAKIPLTPESVDIVGTITTPFKNYETMTSMFKHRFADDLKSDILVQWGRNRFAISTSGDLKITRISRAFNGNLDIRTPFEALRVLVLKGEHTDDYKKFNSKITMDTSRYTPEDQLNNYNMEIAMDHDYSILGLMNTGKMHITMPNDEISTDWEISQQPGKSRAMIDILPQRGNRFKVELLETHQLLPTGNKVTSRFELQIPTAEIREILLTFNHEDRSGFVKTSTSLSKDNLDLISANVDFRNNPSSLQLNTLITSAYTEDVVMTVQSFHSLMPYTGNFELKWGDTPWKISADSNILYDQFGRVKGTVNLNLPLEYLPKITVSTNHEKSGANWESVSSLKFARQVLTADIVYRYDHVKFTEVSLKTNFPQFPGLKTSVRLDGSTYDFNGDAAFEMVPYVPKATTDFRWSYYEGSKITGAFKLNVPVRTFPYLKSSFDSNMMGVSRVSTFNLEYAPAQKITVETDYRFTNLETIEGTVKVTSPFTENKQVISTFTHNGNQEEFTTKARIDSDYFNGPALTEAKFSSKKDIISTFEMSSHFRGYEQVKWDLRHQPKKNGYHTKASYETNGEMIKYENVLTTKDKIQWQLTVELPETFGNYTHGHVLVTHEGDLPNIKSVAEFGFNKQMIKTTTDLTHNRKKSLAKVVITTPYKHFENIQGTFLRTGPVTDLTASFDLENHVKWHSAFKNQYLYPNVFTSALVDLPFMAENVSMTLDHKGEPLDCITSLKYTMGSTYTSIYEQSIKYKLPNLAASAKTTTIKEDDTIVSGIDFKHEQNINEYLKDMEISSELNVLLRNERKVNVDGYLKSDVHPQYGEITSHLIVETFLKDFNYNKVFYESMVRSEDDKKVMGTKFTFETPLLEKVSETRTTTIVMDEEKVPKSLTHKTQIEYGDMKIVTDTFWKPGVVTFTITASDEVSLDIDLSYTHPDLTQPLEAFNTDLTVKGAYLESPFKVTTSHTNRFQADIIIDAYGSVSMTFDNDKSVSSTYKYESESSQVSVEVDTSYKGYESSNLAITYANPVTILITSTAIDQPIKYTSNVDVKSLTDFTIEQLFTSGFTNFSHIEFNCHGTQQNGVRKDGFKWAWENEKQKMIEISTDLSHAWNIGSDGSVKVLSAVYMKTPFIRVSEISWRLGHEHSTNPLRTKEEAMIGLNSKKYFDVEAEFGALNKMYGTVKFRAPREMEFIFSGLNEGESVDANLMLNWNKQERDSNFKMEFALADTGNRYTGTKNFNLKIINPSRTINIVNKFEKSLEKVNSYGTVAWDDSKGEQVDYEASFTFDDSSKSLTRSADISVTVPARKVEVTGSITITGVKGQGTGSLLWDASKDRQKRLDVSIEVDPTDVQKKAKLDVSIPELNKDLSLLTVMSVNDGAHLLNGQTTFAYSPDANKAVVLQYHIDSQEAELPIIDAGWSLEHADTSTYCAMNAALDSTGTQPSGQVVLKYQAANKKTIEALSLRSSLDTDQRNLVVELSSPYHTSSVTGHMTSDSPYLVTIKTMRGNKLAWKSTWKVDTEARTLDAAMTYDNLNKEVVTKAFFPNDTAFTSYTETTGAATDPQGRLDADLADRKLHAHLKWRPQLVNDITVYGGATVQQVGREVSAVVDEGLKDFTGILFNKHRDISSSLETELAPITVAYQDEMKNIQQDLRKMRRELKRMYQRNDLYLKTIDETYTGTVQAMLDGYRAAIIKLNVVYEKVQKMMTEFSEKMDTYPFQEKYNAMVQKLTQAIQEGERTLRGEVDGAVEKIITSLEKVSTLYDDTLKELTDYLRQVLEGLITELALTPYLDDVRAAYDKLSADVIDLTGVDQQDVQKMLLKVHKMFVTTMDESSLAKRYKKVYEETQEIMDQHLSGLRDNKDVQDMHKAVLNLYEQVSWLYQYTEMNMNLRELLQKVMEKLRSKVMEEFNQLPLGLLDLHKSKVTTFDLENGEIEFDLYLPIPMENFDELMRFTVNKYIGKLKQMADKYFPRRDLCLWDVFYSLPHHSWNLKKDLMPPFDVIGTVSGKQHFMTFDGHHYDVSGLCSYVLAEDLVDRNFSVNLRYTGGHRNLATDSLITMVDGKTVEISQNYMVKIDGRPTELPYRTDRLTILRLSSHKVELKSKVGLTVITDFDNDYHIVALSGWYFGKVGGLLGNFDNEKYNDIANPDGQTENRLRRFLNAWEVAGACRSSMMYKDDKPKKHVDECTAVFDASSSSLRPCFTWVDPTPYRDSCDINPASLCDIATLYKDTCSRTKLIDLHIPDVCVQCEGESHATFGGDETLKYSSSESLMPQKSMDVVFVVEERQCNKDVADRLGQMVSQLEDSLSKKGLRNNQYSLVGYEGSEVLSHTMEGQLFNDAAKFSMGLENLRFTNLGPYTDPIKAILYSTQLPFRPGVTKTVVLISCSPCEEASGFTYSSVSNELEQRDITLHVMRNTAFRLKTNRSPKSKIYGLDSESLIYGTGSQRSKDVFDDIYMPQDYCASLALRTNGAVFDASNMLVGGYRQQNHFMGKVGERVRGQVASDMCQVCSCEMDREGLPHTVCRRCDMHQVNFKPVKYAMNKLNDYKNTFVSNIQRLL